MSRVRLGPLMLAGLIVTTAACSSDYETLAPTTTGPSTSTTVAATTSTTTAPMTVTFGQPTELGYRDSLAVEGSGCVDPTTGSSEGLVIGLDESPKAQQGPLFLVKDPDEFHRDQSNFHDNGVTAASDGSFTGTLVAFDDAPAGAISVRFLCARPEQPVAVVADTAGDERVTLRSDLGGISFVPTVAKPGDTVAWNIDCGRSASPGYTTANGAVLGQTLSAVVSDGSVAYGAIRVPSDATPGSYQATARCETQRVGVHRYPTGELSIEAP